MILRVMTIPTPLIFAEFMMPRARFTRVRNNMADDTTRIHTLSIKSKLYSSWLLSYALTIALAEYEAYSGVGTDP